jgi:exodeoxyribonuclease V beta subunit
MIDGMVHDVMQTPLAPGLRLCDVPRNRTVTEMEFALPARHLQATQLSALLTAHGYGIPAFTFGALRGYLRGFIDLVFEHAGRYYVLDWKSNHLGWSAHDYRADALQQAMTRSGYHLQALLYALALHRHLERRLPDYHYDTHFGGIRYLFVRGVRPHWTDRSGQVCGVHAHRPTLAVIRALEQLMDTEVGA